MDKNTIIAIVLSTVVIIASYLLIPLFMHKNAAPAEAEATEVVSEETTVESTEDTAVAETSGESSVISETLFSEEEEKILAEESDIEEQTITINTGVAEVVFTNKGGDIISYKLVNHKDTDTNDAVQISDNVSDLNRTCALALGTSENAIIDEVFSCEKIDDYTVFFKKNFVVQDKNGNKNSFMIGKKYTFKPNEYLFKLDVLVHSNDGKGVNLDGAIYTLRTSPQIGPHYDPKANRYENRQFIAYNGKKAKKVILGSNQFKRYDKDILWSGIAGKYFEELVIPTDPSIWNAAFYSSKVEVNNYANAQGLYERTASNSQDVQDTYYMYFGPRDEKSLKVYNIAENNAWNFGGHKLTESLQSSGWLSWLETILKWCLEILHKVVPNWGACIIILTVILKMIMFPLSIKQSKGTQKMQEIQPKLQAIQSKYANDQKRQQAETQKLYQEAGYNPASGCLPMIFQFLVLFAMYNLFNNYFEFRGSMFIPKWIPDLTLGDSVYKFKFNIPLLGNQLRLLPIIYVATQIISMKITQVGTAGAAQNSMNTKLMTYGMPLLFFFLFYNAPSGLLLYWLTSNIWQVGQQIVINNMMKKDSKAKAVTVRPKGKSANAKLNKTTKNNTVKKI